MVTHQHDWQRMAFMAWALAKYQIDTFLETGCAEGETIGYFSKFAKYAAACDLDAARLEIARTRYPHVEFVHRDVLSFLEVVAAYEKIFFYLDCTWSPGCPAKDQLPIIYKRWRDPIAFVSGVILDNGSSGGQKLSDLQAYGNVIIPTYGMGSDSSGYGLIVPSNVDILLPKGWEVV